MMVECVEFGSLGRSMAPSTCKVIKTVALGHATIHLVGVDEIGKGLMT